MNVALPPAFTCTVLGESQGRSLRIEGHIAGLAGATGTYRIVVRKSGPSGTSRISQGGTFTSSPGRETVVGSTTLSVEPGSGYDVTMQVEAGGTSVTCRSLAGGTL